MFYKKIDFVSDSGSKTSINLDILGLRASLRKLKPVCPYSSHVPPPIINGNRICYDDFGHFLFRYAASLIFKHSVEEVILPHGVFVKAKPISKKSSITIQRCRPIEPKEEYIQSGPKFSGAPYMKNRLFNWSDDELRTVPWSRAPNTELEKVSNFELLAFDFETHPGPGPRAAQPVMVCVTKLNFDNGSIIDLTHFLGIDCHYKLIKWLADYLCAAPPGSLIIVVGFNSSRFDNIYVAAGLASIKGDPRLSKAPRYLETKGRIIDITLSTRKGKHGARSVLSFRDILMYFPVGSRGSLKNMAKNFKLAEMKDEITLDEMRQVADMIIDYQENNRDNEIPSIDWPDPFSKELKYCYQDTRVLYGLTEHMGKILSAMDGPKNAYFMNNPKIPVHFSFIAQFLTLPQTAYKFLPFIFPEDYTSIFQYIVSANEAIICQRSIYGGRTLCGTITQPIYGVVSTDICSEYPSAMCGPMPYGAAYHMGLEKINLINRTLSQDDLFIDSAANLMEIFPTPFIAYCSIFKERDDNQHYDNGVHVVDQNIPFVPYRNAEVEWLSSVYPTGGKPQLRWISDTGGEVWNAVYNCVDIFAMRKLGFKVQISTAMRPIMWAGWSYNLRKIYEDVFKMKALAKRSGDANLELLVKILLNSSIGKFAQRVVEGTEFDGETFSKKKTNNNKTLFHLNSFCMSMSRLINQGHQSLVCKGDHIPNWKWDNVQQINTSVYYCDTDNIIFNKSGWEKVHEQMHSAKLYPQVDFLASFVEAGSYFNMTLEFEEWHKCDSKPNPEIPIVSNVIFLGKKSYVMFCTFCGPKNLAIMNQIKLDHPEWPSCRVSDCVKCNELKKLRSISFRLKAKGHDKSGIMPEDYATILSADPPLPLNCFIPPGEPYNAEECSYRMFKLMYPNRTEFELRNMTSGKRFSFNISLPSSGKISLCPSNIERKYRACIPAGQRRCTTCYTIIQS
jgi:hypothetical protein